MLGRWGPDRMLMPCLWAVLGDGGAAAADNDDDDADDDDDDDDDDHLWVLLNECVEVVSCLLPKKEGVLKGRQFLN